MGKLNDFKAGAMRAVTSPAFWAGLLISAMGTLILLSITNIVYALALAKMMGAFVGGGLFAFGIIAIIGSFRR